MGKIIVFSLDDCGFCKKVKAALSVRCIPFVEISLSSHPEKRRDMLALSDRLTVPQVFFNDAFIGGSVEVIKILSEWDLSDKAPLEFYKADIEPLPEPNDERLMIPTGPPLRYPKAPKRTLAHDYIFLPDGSTKSIFHMTRELMKLLPRNDLMFLAKVYRNCFTGEHFVDAITEHFNVSELAAIEFGNSLKQHQIVHHVCNADHDINDTTKYFFRLQPFHTPDVLNSFRIWTDRIDPDPIAVLGRLRKMLSKMEGEAINENGQIDYLAVAQNKLFLKFDEASSELQSVRFSLMDDKTKLAFCINLYNVMIRHAFIKVGIPQNSMNRSAFYGTVSYNVGGHMLSFNDIEHGIIRANARPPYSLFHPFGERDPRRGLALQTIDPRIHFALNCGANSCPSIEVYTPHAIEEELRIVAFAFCECDSNVMINSESYEIIISMIMHWYRADFASSVSSLPDKIVKFLRGDKKAKLEAMIDSGKPIRVSYSSYDWGANSSQSLEFFGSQLSTQQWSVDALLRLNLCIEVMS
mmetsp:Transcript_18406/g.21180  ORF Transcript_18406/g.21180 Transcript_18406/m.21180 type:complete len:524 (+) Transcript_18406:35-1606(+)